MKSQKPINPRKTPKQSRSRFMVDVIVSSATRILVTEGYDRFTTNRVAEVAGVSVGSIYQYFPNKDSLISEIARRHVTDLLTAINEAYDFAAHNSLQDVARQIVRNHIAIHNMHPKLHRALSREIPRLGHLEWKAGMKDVISEKLQLLLKKFPETCNIENPDMVIFVLFTTVESVVDRALVEKPELINSGALEETLTKLILSYLKASMTYLESGK